MRAGILLFSVLLAGGIAIAEEPAGQPESEAAGEARTTSEAIAAKPAGSTKTMSGMSILGNEEAPKSLVIVPWKSSELGDDLSLSDSLDDRAHPVDREVFLRELSYFAIRSAD